MATITMIPAKKKIGSRGRDQETPKLRVAAYCRVSTDSEEQATSYEAQIEHYTEYIRNHPGWEMAGIYADDGISGTNTKKREEFNRMIEDCMAGRVDLVVTKSISRFARNTLDCLKYIRQLKEQNIAVYFEKENINTLDAKGEVLLTIMASLAQQESQSLSQNVRIGLQYRFQQGKVQVCTNRFLGYDKDEDGNLIINEKEAEVVKRIYREYLEGRGYYEIGKGLETDGILTAAGKSKWRVSTIRNILRNEKYIGDALLQKTVTVDFLNKKRVANTGIVPQYYVEGSHEAIISKQVYYKVQEEMARRANLQTGTGKRRVYSGKYALSSIVYCAHCGDVYRRTHWNNRGRKTVVWRCVSRLMKKNSEIECTARTITEEELHTVVIKAVNRVYNSKDSYMPQLKRNIEIGIGSKNGEQIAEFDCRIEELQKQILERINKRMDYDDIGKEIHRLKEEKYRIQLEQANNEELSARIKDLGDYLEKLGNEPIDYSEDLVRRLIERVTVWDDRFTVEFKSGIEIDV